MNRPPAKLAKLKRRVRERDSHQCVVCGVSCHDRGHVHHRRFRSRGGLDEMANLILVCQRCHDRIHIFDQQTAEWSGWAVSAAGDGPESIPVTYFDGREVLLSNEIRSAA